MPNGHDKNWHRLCAALDGFRLRYGRWPKCYRAPGLIVDDLRGLFTPRDLLTLTSKIRLVVDDARLVAEDDDGGRYSFGTKVSQITVRSRARKTGWAFAQNRSRVWPVVPV